MSLCAVGLTGAPLFRIAAETAQVDARLDLRFGEHEAYRSFLQELPVAVSERARELVAAMVNYPLRTRIKGKWVRRQTPTQFFMHYEDVLTPKTLRAIARQTDGELFPNSQGVMIGTGEVCYGGVCKDRSRSSRSLKIIAVNP